MDASTWQQPPTVPHDCDEEKGHSPSPEMSFPVNVRKAGTIIDVAPGNRRTLHVRWADDVGDVLDLMPLLIGSQRYKRVRTDDTLFRTARIVAGGSVIEWADGSSIPAQRLRVLSRLKMTSGEFRDAMEAMGLTYDGMAALLGVSRRMIGAWRGGGKAHSSIHGIGGPAPCRAGSGHVGRVVVSHRGHDIM